MSVVIAMQLSADSFSLEMLSRVFNLHLLVRFLLICKLLYKNIVLIVRFTVYNFFKAYSFLAHFYRAACNADAVL